MLNSHNAININHVNNEGQTVLHVAAAGSSSAANLYIVKL